MWAFLQYLSHQARLPTSWCRRPGTRHRRSGVREKCRWKPEAFFGAFWGFFWSHSRWHFFESMMFPFFPFWWDMWWFPGGWFESDCFELLILMRIQQGWDPVSPDRMSAKLSLGGGGILLGAIIFFLKIQYKHSNGKSTIWRCISY